MKFGIHMKTAGGLTKALESAQALQCETVQLFSANPNSWHTKEPDPAECERFVDQCRALGIDPVVLHTPYLLNLASPDDEIWNLSVNALCYAIRKADMLRAESIVTHIGSHKGAGVALGIGRIAEAVGIALDCGWSGRIALELGAGAGRTIGSTFQEMESILSHIDSTDRVGICIDTAHLYASGYDISTSEGADSMFCDLHAFVGCEKLLVVHLNDTIMALSSHRDKHHGIGEGNIGLEGFRSIVNHPCTCNTPGIIETPANCPEDYARNLNILRSLRVK